MTEGGEIMSMYVLYSSHSLRNKMFVQGAPIKLVKFKISQLFHKIKRVKNKYKKMTISCGKYY